MRKIMRKTEAGKKMRGGDPLMRLYLKEISKIPLLTAEEEKELGRRAKKGDLTAQQKLTESNLRFVIKIARKFARRPDQLMELINVGNVGLIEAVRRFDPERDVRFTSYAIWWIRQAIFHHLANMSHAFRVSPKSANIVYRVAKVLNTMRPEGKVPGQEELAKLVGVSVKELNAALEANAVTLSLDQPIDEEGQIMLRDLLEQQNVPSPENHAVMKGLRQDLDKSIRILKPMERRILRLRFGLNEEPPMTLRQVGEQMNLSRERIRQIERDALNKLRQIRATQSLAAYLH